VQESDKLKAIAVFMGMLMVMTSVKGVSMMTNEQKDKAAVEALDTFEAFIGAMGFKIVAK